MRIEMNKEILDVILAVLAYKEYVYRHNNIISEDDFDWYRKTEKYYYSLPLPDGMKKNISDFEAILSYGSSKCGKGLLKTLCSVEPAKLNEYNWRNY
jgi:hypothetical protein